MFRSLIAGSMFFIGSIALMAQSAFYRADHLMPKQWLHSGSSIAVCDMNGDLLDDLVLASKGWLLIAYQNSNNARFFVDTVSAVSTDVWSMAMADLDGNGMNDILLNDEQNGHIFYNYPSGFVHRQENYPQGFFPQSCNIIDFDRDGDLDFFVLNDSGQNRAMRRDTNGYTSIQLWDDTDGQSYDGSGNYGSVWTDIDCDGDLDVFLAKCRAGVSDSTDRRRINRFYFFDDGQYVNRAETLGLASGKQSWSADIGDINNDGLQDIFVVNHYAANELYLQNQDGSFSDRSDWIAVQDNGFAFQSLMTDIDNDGWLDILVAGTKNLLFLNQSGQGFRAIEMPLSSRSANSFVHGDFNSDGYPDILASYPVDINKSGNRRDLLWLNKGGTHHYVKFLLQGESSNRSAIGARLQLYGPWGIQTREIRAGESYGLSRSLTAVYGMGEANRADSLVIFWPNGLKETFDNIQADRLYRIHEGQCIEDSPFGKLIYPPSFCENSSRFLYSEDSNSIIWSDGSTGDSLLITAPGNYFGTFSDGTTCFERIYPSVHIESHAPDTQLYAGDLEWCEGEGIALAAPMGTGYLWSTGSTDSVVYATTSASFTLQYTDVCGQTQSLATDTFKFFSVSPPTVFSDTVTQADTLTLVAFGQDVVWFADSNGVHEVHRGDTLRFFALRDTVFYAADQASVKKNYATFAAQSSFEKPDRAGLSINGGLYFDVLRPTRINSVKVRSERTGARKILIYDQADRLVYSQLFDIDEGQQTLNLNVDLPVGQNYLMTTDTTTNILLHGKTGPDFDFFHMLDHFPVGIENRIQVNGSTHGSMLFWYFYDWQIEDIEPCFSERVAVAGVVDLGTANVEPESYGVQIYPNPTEGRIFIKVEGAQQLRLSLYDLYGRELKTKRTNFEPLVHWDLSDVQAGLYYFVLQDEAGKRMSLRISIL